MGEMITRDELDRRMGAWQMYYIDKMATTTIAAHYGVSRQSIRNWLVSLGGQLDDSDIGRAMRDKIVASLPAGTMLCRECDVITPAHDSGLCPMCRGDEEGNDEHKAWLEFEAGWLRRNLCGGKR